MCLSENIVNNPYQFLYSYLLAICIAYWQIQRTLDMITLIILPIDGNCNTLLLSASIFIALLRISAIAQYLLNVQILYDYYLARYLSNANICGDQKLNETSLLHTKNLAFTMNKTKSTVVVELIRSVYLLFGSSVVYLDYLMLSIGFLILQKFSCINTVS